jgi:hypothetical protein
MNSFTHRFVTAHATVAAYPKPRSQLSPVGTDRSYRAVGTKAWHRQVRPRGSSNVERPGPATRVLVLSLLFPLPLGSSIMMSMERPNLQMKMATMLGLVACIALNFWLFRLGVFWGILGLNVTKHVAIAYLCQVLGVDRRPPVQAPSVIPARPPHVPVT